VPYIHKSQWIAQSIHQFINIYRAFHAGVPDAQCAGDAGLDESSRCVLTEDNYQLFDQWMWQKSHQVSPTFLDYVEVCGYIQ